MPEGAENSELSAGRVPDLPSQPRPSPHRHPHIAGAGLGPSVFLSFSSCSAQQGRPIVQGLGAEREKLSNTASKGQALCKACHSQGRRTDDTGQSVRGLQGRSRAVSGEGGGDQANQMGGRVGLVCKQPTF